MLGGLERKVACDAVCSRILEARLSQFERRPGDQGGGQRKDTLVRLPGAPRYRFVAGSPRGRLVLFQGPAFSCGSASFAPDTGSGESFLTWDGSQYLAHRSEGGHSDFAPTDEHQIRLLHFLLPRFGHVGVEHVGSGFGVPNIYEFLCDEEDILEQSEIAQLIESAKDHSKAIVDAAFDPQHPSELCLATVDLLVSILASEAGNLGLKALATGGVYLSGGIALHLVKLLQKQQFVQTFTRKGRFKNLMERVAIHIITTRAALLGAATFPTAEVE